MNTHHSLHVLSSNAKPLLYGFVLFSLLTYFITTRFLTRKTSQEQRPRTPDLEKPSKQSISKFKAPERPPGVWTPVDFERPSAPPYPDWDAHTTEPQPYRPFKHGPYHITMGLRTMKWDNWIELDNQFLKFHDTKAERIKERGDKCCRTAPEAYDGAVELLEELYFSRPPLLHSPQLIDNLLERTISPNATQPSTPAPQPT